MSTGTELLRHTVKNANRISGHFFNRFFLVLENLIVDRGNSFSLPGKGLFFLCPGIFPPKVLSRKYRGRFLARESHQDLGRIPGCESVISRKTPSILLSSVANSFQDNLATVVIKFDR
jgi:hypothetical protein